MEDEAKIQSPTYGMQKLHHQAGQLVALQILSAHKLYQALIKLADCEEFWEMQSKDVEVAHTLPILTLLLGMCTHMSFPQVLSLLCSFNL